MGIKSNVWQDMLARLDIVGGIVAEVNNIGNKMCNTWVSIYFLWQELLPNSRFVTRIVIKVPKSANNLLEDQDFGLKGNIQGLRGVP